MNTQGSQRRKMLFWQLARGYVVITIALSLLYYLLFTTTWNAYRALATQRLHRTLGENVAQQLQDVLRAKPFDESALSRRFYLLSQINPSLEFYLISKDGKIIASNRTYERVQKIAVEPIKTFLKGSESRVFAVYGDNPRSNRSTTVFSAAPVRYGDEPGYLYITLESELAEATQGMLGDFTFTAIGVAILLFSLCTAFLIGLRFFWRITGRFRRMTSVVRQFESGELDARISDAGKDEIAEHANAFDRMAEAISSNINELAQADELRKEFISNITHDLRMPISTMQTSLETQLIDYSNLDDAGRQELLELALANCQRLGRLISQLFEVTKLDSRERLGQQEEFSLSDLCSDVCNEFRAIAQSREITLQFQSEEELPFVSGDIELLERAMRNLIENAIRYSQSGDEVSVLLEASSSAVKVSVRDTGLGIAESDLEKIFERFYRADNARKHSNNGSGLGLAIVKRIIAFHGSQLHVQSRLGEGTTFSFELPVSE